jgi:hypothetical protein
MLVVIMLKQLSNGKMRHMIAMVLSLLLLLSLLPSAHATGSTVEIEYLEDGSYFVTELEEAKPVVVPFSSTTTVTRSKKTSAYSTSGEIVWYVQVTGTFTYGNGTAVCTASSVTAKSNQTNWQITSQSASRSGASATATATAAKKVLGLTTSTQTRSVTLTCSSTGTFS